MVNSNVKLFMGCFWDTLQVVCFNGKKVTSFLRWLGTLLGHHLGCFVSGHM